MSKSLKMRNEEYAPGASFLLTSFEGDQAAIVSLFSEFDAAYKADFELQIKKVEKMDQGVVVSEQRKDATKLLNGMVDGLNTQLNVVAFRFQRAGLPTKLVTQVKEDLKSGNVEGGCMKMEGLIQLMVEKKTALATTGMPDSYPDELAQTTEKLRDYNKKQNELMNVGEELTSKQLNEYQVLFGYIKDICRAGKIVFDGTVKEDEYNMTKLIKRMRSGNSGGGKES